MKSATTATKTKGAMVRSEPKTIHTVDIDASAQIPWPCCKSGKRFIWTMSLPADL